MTKTLTEQWRDGTIEYGLYYVRIVGRNDITIADTNLDEELNVEEVLAPVPSYEEYNDLIQKNVNQESDIETYIERIKELEEQIPNGTWFTQKSHKELLNKIEQLQKRLEIATKTLQEYARCENGSYANKALSLIKEVK
jgi:hypothetical protein